MDRVHDLKKIIPSGAEATYAYLQCTLPIPDSQLPEVVVASVCFRVLEARPWSTMLHKQRIRYPHPDVDIYRAFNS